MKKIVFIGGIRYSTSSSKVINVMGKDYENILKIDYTSDIPLIPKFSNIITSNGLYQIWEIFTDITANIIYVEVIKKTGNTQI